MSLMSHVRLSPMSISIC